MRQLTARIGVMTGEVVTGTEERLATGDPVNVAARLETADAFEQALARYEWKGNLARAADSGATRDGIGVDRGECVGIVHRELVPSRT